MSRPSEARSLGAATLRRQVLYNICDKTKLLNRCCRTLTLAAELGDLGDDRQGNLLRRDGPKVEASRCPDGFEAHRLDAIGDQLAAKRRHFPTTADKAVIGRLKSKSGFQRRLVAPALGGYDDEPLSFLRNVDAESVEEAINLGDVRQVVQRRGERDLIS